MEERQALAVPASAPKPFTVWRQHGADEAETETGVSTMKSSTKEAVEFVAALMQETPNRNKAARDVTEPALILMKLARELATINLAWCNVGMTPRQAKRRANIIKTIGVTVRQLGIKEIETSGDPRGAALKLKMPSGNGNSWGGEGFYCVPEGC